MEENVIQCEEQTLRNTVLPVPLNVLVAGHSFVYRLHQKIGEWIKDGDKKDYSLELAPGQARVSWIYKPGATVQSIQSSIKNFIERKARKAVDIVVIQIGSNDLCAEDPYDLSLSLSNYVDELLKICSRVVCMQVLHRGIRGITRSTLSVEQYNENVDKFNKYMRTFLGMKSGAFFWDARKALAGKNCQPLDSDGTHLKPQKMKEYYRNLRGAVGKAIADYWGLAVSDYTGEPRPANKPRGKRRRDERAESRESSDERQPVAGDSRK